MGKAQSERILVVVDGLFPSTGGAEIQARLLMRSLASAGHQVRAVAPLLSPSQAATEVVDGVPLRRIPYPRLRLLGALVLCLRFGWMLLAKRRHYDAIHVHMAKNLAATAGLLRPWLPATLTVKISGAWEFNNGILDPRMRHRAVTRLYNACIRRADTIQCISDYTRRQVLAAGYPPSRVRLIPNAVDTVRFNPALAVGTERPIVVFIGRLVPVKGLPVLLEAWQRVMTQTVAQLVIAGAGPESDHLQQLAHHLGIARSVCFVGEIEDVTQVLATANVYVQPSHVEGLSNAVLEAMACGLPIVATRISGNEDLVSDGINGLLVPPGDAAALAAALQTLLDQPALARAMGYESRKVIDADYAIPVVLEGLLDAYRAKRAGQSANG